MEINSTIAIIYCIVAVISAAILFLCTAIAHQTTARHSIKRYVVFAFLFGGLAAIFDCAYILREAKLTQFHDAFNYIFIILYVIFASLTGTYWVIYSEKKQKSWFVQTKLRLALYSLPLFLLLLFVITTPFTKWFIYFVNGEYKRGPLFVGISVLLIFYVLQTGGTAFIRSFKKENYVERKEYRRLFYFAITYLTVQTIQLLSLKVFPYFPYRSVGLMLLYLVYLILNLKETIGHDALTNINNRFAAERHLGNLFKNKDDFEMCILDIDKFKSINDTHGHIEGDKALQYLSNVLTSFNKDGYFISRMGGDEFIIVNTNTTNSIINIEEDINSRIKQVLQDNNCEYSFTVSVGYAYKDDTIKSVPDMLSLADKKMYERKNSKR